MFRPMWPAALPPISRAVRSTTDSTVDANGQDSPFAVYNISKVEGQTYAGGFAGKLYSGALADAGGGVSILGSIGISSVTDLLSVAQAYVPVAEYAGVQSSARA